jgi:CubicO group peptidase (beta-lactamase class C family)
MRITRVFLVSAGLFAGALRAQAPVAAPVPENAAFARARAVLDPVAAKYPGLAVAVAVNGEIVWAEGWGFADVAGKVRATADTPFRIYSVVKPMTAAALVRLAADGRVDLDAPVQKYVPGYPVKPGPAVTLRLLAAHLGGVRHYGKGEAVSRKSCATPSDALAAFAGDPLLYPPGTKEEYSSYGYVLVSAAIEAVTGKPFEDAMRELVFAPAGMTGTVLDRAGRPVPGRAISYDGKAGDWRESDGADVTCKFGAGGFLATANDMARFGSALLAGKIVPPDRVAGLFEPARTTAGEETSFGAGWGASRTGTGARLGVMSGGNVGGRSALVADPVAKIVVAIAANTEGPRLSTEARKILEAFGGAR